MTACKSVGASLLAASLLLLCACGDYADSGPLRTETRDVETFDSIDMEGAARIEITMGGSTSVSVEGADAVLQRVKTEVRGDTLYIESKPKDWISMKGRPRVTVRIAVPHLASLKLEGGNDVHLSGFAGGESAIDVEGAARINATGRLDELTVHMAGAGHVDLSKLVADNAKVTVDGVGSVIVHPKETLDATMNGVGAILYTGSPRQVNTRMNGLGTIGQRGSKEADSDQEPEIDPDTLQPEYQDPEVENTGGSTEVI